MYVKEEPGEILLLLILIRRQTPESSTSDSCSYTFRNLLHSPLLTQLLALFALSELKPQGKSASTLSLCGFYIIGSMLRAGWFFSVRNATSASGSVVMVTSPTISVKLSIPYSSFAVSFRRSAT